jgi:hypothetical protein
MSPSVPCHTTKPEFAGDPTCPGADKQCTVIEIVDEATVPRRELAARYDKLSLHGLAFGTAYSFHSFTLTKP